MKKTRELLGRLIEENKKSDYGIPITNTDIKEVREEIEKHEEFNIIAWCYIIISALIIGYLIKMIESL